MLPARASAAAVPKRLQIYYMPNGIRMPEYTPATVGRDYAMTPILSPLERHRDNFTVITGLANYNGQPLGDPPAGHAPTCAAYLTGTHPKHTEGADIQCGISMDQVVAAEFGKQTQFASLEVGIESPMLMGACDIGYSCSYTNTLSWRTPTVPLPVTVTPSDLFARLFGSGDVMDEKTRAMRRQLQASILDTISEDASSLTGKLGMNDRRKLDEYLEAIRDVERRIQRASEQKIEIDYSELVRPATGIPVSFEDHVKTMVDLQILAMQADLTRVCTFMQGREISNRTYPQIGVPDSHHMLSHHGGDPEKLAKLVRINQLHMQQFALYLDRMKNTADGEGSLLDSTLVLAGACLGEPDDHDCMNLPAIVAGGGFAGNQHIVVPKHTPMSNLLLTLIQNLGLPQESFGDSTGSLSLTS
ncbi:MAG: DUF1552 domain-containing protein [Pseudomonadota bacterium]